MKNITYRNFFYSEKFALKDEFIKKFIGKQPEWGPLGYVTYKRTYARFLEKENRKEEYFETVRRVVEGCFSIQKDHCKKLKLPWNQEKANSSAEIMYEKIWNFKMTPPGRGFWIMGTNFIKEHGSMALNNCGFVSTEDIDLKYSKPFEFMMNSLMLGVGVGFDTKGSKKITIKKPKNKETEFQIPDSREGWIKALKTLLNAYFLGKELPIFDYSQIRSAGKPIRSFGGIAPGPKPLKKLINKIDDLLKDKIGKRITSTDILDIMNLIGTCVVAGGIRRSAQIALGNPDDKEFIEAKQDKERLRSHRWVSNNSIIADIGTKYADIVKQIKKNGEPGIFWLNNARKFSRMIDPPDFKDKKAMGINPCGEQTLESFELCCLVETYPSRHENFEEFKETLKYAYLYAKTVTLVNTHIKVTNAVMLKNRRIGISQTGITEAFDKHGRREILNWCQKGYNYLKEIDEKYSHWLCVPKSIKLTTVKPSGTVSLLPGVAHGIHYPHSEYYIRRIRVSKNSDIVKALKKSNYQIKEDLYSDNTLVVEFPVQKENFNRSKDEVSIWEQAENAADYQKYWSDNQVSITISFQEDEEEEIQFLLECFEDKLKSVSFLPFKRHGYEQPPYEKITKEEYQKRNSQLKPLVLKNIRDRAKGDIFCDDEGCEIKIDFE
ncbi:MAG: fused protease/ribonucleoside-triphosphate reductase [Candidatus Lokiarchaeota archaeon]|nr:fused protease/ribonucleoside-triphosphate reductase [Candidatus Lokiarchaeota archaeon]MBD3339714.1 fused protease/ribonucleoside-triphosphate reductase [Candidatus Lokiarchaeota archaeon]